MKVELTDVEAQRVSTMIIEDMKAKAPGAKAAYDLWHDAYILAATPDHNESDANSARHVLATLDTPYIRSLVPRIMAIKLGDTEYEP